MHSTVFALAFVLPLLVRAGSRSTEAQEAAIKNANAECTPYDYPPVDAITHLYPKIWVTADLTNSTPAYDLSVFNSIKAGIPNIAPRGNRAGNFQGVNYNATDPYCWWSWNKCTTPKLPGLKPDVTRCEEPNSWGFTLDDGPNCSHNAYFDYLLSINQKATLFYIGSNVIDWPLEAQRGLSDGHEICSHSWSHPYMTSLTDEQAFAELYYSKKIIKDILGITVRCFRPPYGDTDDRIRYIAQQLDLSTIIWEDDTDDYEWVDIGMPAIQKNYNNIISNAKSGAYATHGTIVLTHEIDNGTMELSEEFLPTIMSTFTGGVMPVAVCMNNTSPYLEQNNSYVYPNYQQWMQGTRSVTLLPPTAVSKDIRLHFGANIASSASATQPTSAPVFSGGTSTSTSSGHSSSSSAASTSTEGGKPSAGVVLTIGWGLLAALSVFAGVNAVLR